MGNQVPGASAKSLLQPCFAAAARLWEGVPALLQLCRGVGDEVKEKVLLEHVWAVEFQMPCNGTVISQWVSG